MNIHIVRKSKNFTQIDNALLRDERLSPAALGLLCRLLSHDPETWVISVIQVRKSFKLTEHTCRKLFKELQGLGYAELTYERVGGKILGSRWVIYECPIERPSTTQEGLESSSRGQQVPRLEKAQEPVKSQTKSRAPKGQGKLEKKGIVRLEDGALAILLKPKSEPVHDVDMNAWDKLNNLLKQSSPLQSEALD